jgi:hypothetical protein
MTYTLVAVATCKITSHLVPSWRGGEVDIDKWLLWEKLLDLLGRCMSLQHDLHDVVDVVAFCCPLADVYDNPGCCMAVMKSKGGDEQRWMWQVMDRFWMIVTDMISQPGDT